LIIGIDLGTTNSAASVWRDGRAELIPNGLGDFLTPSAVSVDSKNNYIVGIAARERLATRPKESAASFKRYMGTDHKLKLGSRKYLPEELSALILQSLKTDAEKYLGCAVDRAVITVPAYFNDKQRRATRRAGELAGLTVERLINEPTAAALAYGLHERDQSEPFLIFDLGGGTFDVSLVEMFEGVIEVRASAGDNRLGGDDFNDILIDLAQQQLGSDLFADFRENGLYAIVRETAERARRQLSDNDDVEMRFVWKGQEHRVAVTAEAFEAAAAPLLDKLKQPVLRSLRDSGTRATDLGEIILVGGATRMPIVRRAATRMFGRFPNSSVHPDHAVALGAAIQAGLKARDADLAEVRLTDVCPFTLGVDNAEPDGRGGWRTGIFSPIIERNTIIPASRMQEYRTIADNQAQVEFNIFQGESRDVKANVHIGKIVIDVPPRRAGQVYAECRFTYDTSGLLEVDVTVPATGLSEQVVIYDKEDAALRNDLDSRRAALAKLKIHPRDDIANSAVIARAVRCYENFLGETRNLINHEIGIFEASLATQDPRTIDTARAALTAVLDRLEGERYL
jgi:molecular chaperone HscC